jgi:hypothetical protein
VLREVVRASEHTDIDAEVQKLRFACERSGLPNAVADLIVSQVRQTLTDLVVRGQELAALGSHMVVTRKITGEGYNVTIAFNAGTRSLIRRIIDAVRGR